MSSEAFGRVARLVVALLVLAAPVLAQGTPGGRGTVPPSGPGEAAVPDTYLVAPRDVVRILVFDEPTLTGTFTVDVDGSIQYPLVGRLTVGGMTLREIEEMVTTRLMDGFVRRPQVTVEIQSFRPRSVFVMGEVRTPGEYPIEGRLTLLEALAAAGSTTAGAGTQVLILHGADGDGPVEPGPDAQNVTTINLQQLQRGVISQNVALQDGDTVFVPQAQRFFVSGEVNNPGVFTWRPGLTVLQAVTLAGGLTERGSNRRIQVIRIMDDEQVTDDIDLDALVEPDVTINVRRRLF